MPGPDDKLWVALRFFPLPSTGCGTHVEAWPMISPVKPTESDVVAHAELDGYQSVEAVDWIEVRGPWTLAGLAG